MDFEEYLAKVFADSRIVPDDDFPDQFNLWLEDLPIDSVILMANEWKDGVK